MYSRKTELRHLRHNDLYKLSQKLDENNLWIKLMVIIPKELNVKIDGTIDWEKAKASGMKYGNGHITQIESAFKRPGETRQHSQILFDEWSTSGKKPERPTLGVLMELLIEAQLLRAADYVAEELLNEQLPNRPSDGPGAAFDISLPTEIIQNVENIVNGLSIIPETEVLQQDVNIEYSLQNNIDYCTKFKPEKHLSMLNNVNGAPVPPPRTKPKSRLNSGQQQQKQTQQSPGNGASTAEAYNALPSNQQQLQPTTSNNLPDFSAILQKASTSNIRNNSNTTSTGNYDMHTESTTLSDALIPALSVLGGSTITSSSETTVTTNTQENLPNVSGLNINGGPENYVRSDSNQENHTFNSSNYSSEMSASFEGDNYLPRALQSLPLNGRSDEYHVRDNIEDAADDDDDDDSLPNSSTNDQRSLNNDSSLTNVTASSGENSFELMNECNSASDENLPCLSAFKPKEEK